MFACNVVTDAIDALRSTSDCVAYPAMVPFTVRLSVINASPFTVSIPSVVTPLPAKTSPNGLSVPTPVRTFKLSIVVVPVMTALFTGAAPRQCVCDCRGIARIVV